MNDTMKANGAEMARLASRAMSISNFVQNSSGSLTTQDAINGRQVTRAGEVRL